MAFSIGLFLALILFYFFETEGFIEWLSLIRLSKCLPYFAEYKNVIELGGKVRYLDFLIAQDNSFLIKLLTCPLCLSFWLSIFLSIITEIKFYPIINFIGLIGFFLLRKNQYKV